MVFSRLGLTGAAVVVVAGLSTGTVLVLLRKAPVLNILLRSRARTSTPFVQENSVVLLTGCTSPESVGAHVALRYHARPKPENAGVTLILVGEQELAPLLEHLTHAGDVGAQMVAMLLAPTTRYFAIDFSSPTCGHQLAELLRKDAIVHVDAAVQLEAVDWREDVSILSESTVRSLVRVNLLAPVLIAKHVLPFLDIERARVGTSAPAKRSKLVFVGSTTSQTPASECATSNATRAGLDQFAWSLRAEFADSNVAVQLLHLEPRTSSTSSAARVSMAWRVHSTIDHSSSFRETFGSLKDRITFHVHWLLQHRWRLTSFVRWCLDSRLDRVDGVCVITGGSKGIGQALLENRPVGRALILDRTGAADPDRCVLHETVDFASDDVASPCADALSRLAQPVSVLVSNAGVNISGRLSFLSDEDVDRMVQVNFVAPIVLVAECIKYNATRGVRPPDMCFVCSASCYLGYPGSAVYAASKDALASFARSMRSAGVSSVLSVFPGPTRTEQARMASPSMTEEEEAQRASGRMDPSELAQEIWEYFLRGETLLVPRRFRSLTTRAILDPEWASAFMCKMQLEPLVAKHIHMYGHAGL